MAEIPYHVAEAFRERRNAKSGAFVAQYDRLLSYALLLAYRDRDGRIVYDYPAGREASPTTKRHMRALEAVIPREWERTRDGVVKRVEGGPDA